MPGGQLQAHGCPQGERRTGHHTHTHTHTQERERERRQLQAHGRPQGERRTGQRERGREGGSERASERESERERERERETATTITRPPSRRAAYRSHARTRTRTHAHARTHARTRTHTQPESRRPQGEGRADHHTRHTHAYAHTRTRTRPITHKHTCICTYHAHTRTKRAWPACACTVRCSRAGADGGSRRAESALLSLRGPSSLTRRPRAGDACRGRHVRGGGRLRALVSARTRTSERARSLLLGPHTLMSVGIGALFPVHTRTSVRPLRPQSTHARACGLSGARRPSSAWERRSWTGSSSPPPTSRRAPGPRRGARNSAGGSTPITSRVIWERFRVLAVGAAHRGRTAVHVPTRGRPHAAAPGGRPHAPSVLTRTSPPSQSLPPPCRRGLPPGLCGGDPPRRPMEGKAVLWMMTQGWNRRARARAAGPSQRGLDDSDGDDGHVAGAFRPASMGRIRQAPHGGGP